MTDEEKDLIEMAREKLAGKFIIDEISTIIIPFCIPVDWLKYKYYNVHFKRKGHAVNEKGDLVQDWEFVRIENASYWR